MLISLSFHDFFLHKKKKQKLCLIHTQTELFSFKICFSWLPAFKKNELKDLSNFYFINSTKTINKAGNVLHDFDAKFIKTDWFWILECGVQNFCAHSFPPKKSAFFY